MGMSNGFVAPPPPNMVPQGMYPVTMGAPQQRPGGPYPPQQQNPGGPYPPQRQPQPPPMYPQQVPPMASTSMPGPQGGAPPAPAKPRVNPDTMPLSQIDTLSDAQIEEMLANDASLTTFVKSLPYVIDYMLHVDEAARLQSEVDSLNKRTTSTPEALVLKQDLERKRDEFQRKSEQKRQKETELTQNALYSKLDAAAKITDGECEEIASRFLSGDMSAQDFSKAYKEKRILYHTRSAKKEAIMHSM